MAVKQAFAQWQVTGLDEEEDEGWGMSGQKAKVKKWARPATQRNYANAYLNARQSLVFEGALYCLSKYTCAIVRQRDSPQAAQEQLYVAVCHLSTCTALHKK